MKFGPVAVKEAEGVILAHAINVSGSKLPKGKKLSAADLAALESAGVKTVIAAQLDADDLGEDEAAARVAEAIVLDGVKRSQPGTGRVNFYASKAGLFRVDRDLIDRLNSIDPAITIATLEDRAPVYAGDMVATVKIIPLAVSGRSVAAGVSALRDEKVFRVAAYCSSDVGLIATTLPHLKPSVMDKTRRLLEQRLKPSGSRVISERRVEHSTEAVTGALRTEIGVRDMVIIFGASAMTDQDDVIPAAIRAAGGEVTIAGMPVDPGNLLVLGWLEGKPVIGAPGCARSPKENAFDWILNRVLTGERPNQADAAKLGVGGLLMEIPLRPQPRETARPPEAPLKIGIALLAAGKASRMGGKQHKLLAKFNGETLVKRSARTALASGADDVVVVTGHRAADVTAALAGLDLKTAQNADFATGMASSIRAGLAALEEVDGLCIMLADMPGVTAEDMQSLISAFCKAKGEAVVRAVSAGKRGNPVILPKSLFGAIRRLEGDVGARHIIEKSGMDVIDVEIGAAAHLDVDTPDAIVSAGGELGD